ncbi:hypothetical protein [Epilithonimonas hominis]|uniref:Uncharacterized protein n=1 Tax=Epilithonimonas hominis TaxID=420404 RepID=A0A3N0XAR1_9FLAO|nr:hypothetical protein [Epilithonimonas hominis]ROI14464.1 hypothetical protein EGH73_03055 [Epilithonimonas hominis]
MKNIIKLSLVALGIVTATIASSSKLLANVPPDGGGYCNPTTETVCGVTSGGFTAKGFFVTN